MAEHTKSVDISMSPDLLRLAEEVHSSNEPRMLTRDHEQLAVVMPVSVRPAKRRRKAPSAEDLEAFRSAAGGWKGIVDVDKLVEDIYESRRISTRPPVEL
jgi:hypothetical protein